MRRFLTVGLFLLLAAVVVAVFVLPDLWTAQPVEEAPAPVEVEFYQQREEATRAFAQVITRYAAVNPMLRINHQNIPNSLMVLLARVQRGDIPALFTHWPTQYTFAQMMREGVMLELTDQPWLDRVDPASRALCTLPDGSIYALPINRNCMEVFYNKTIFEAHGLTPPDTVEGFFAVCEALQAEGIAPLVLCVRDTTRISHVAQAVLTAMVPDAMAALGRIGGGTATDAETQQVRNAMEMLYRINQQYNSADALEAATVYDTYDSFARGDCAMMICGSYATSEIISRDPVGEIAVFPFPGETAQDRRMISSIDTAVSIAADLPLETQDMLLGFLSYLTEPDVADAYAAADLAPSCITGVTPAHPIIEQMQTHIDSYEIGEWLKHFCQQEAALAFDEQVQRYLVGGDLDGFMAALSQVFAPAGEGA